MNSTYYPTLIFELSKEGRSGVEFPENRFPNKPLEQIGESLKRDTPLNLPCSDEGTVARHYTNMSGNNFGVDTGMYPLGSCTMKYNPKVNELLSALPGFQNIHPLQEEDTVQGALRLYWETARLLSKIAGMREFTLNPFAGAHGEVTGLMIIRRYHESRGDMKRTKVLVPSSAHGTNPASAAMAGMEVVEVKSTDKGTVDVADLRMKLNDETAAMMMTNPNTLGLFESDIPEIARLVHASGGLMYYDGANLNPILGVCRPGDMGFDVMHINLHKTFSTPHGGGGPGSGPVGVRDGLEEFLPNPRVVYDEKADRLKVEHKEGTMGSVSTFLGNFSVVVRAYAYLLSMGREGIKEAGIHSVLSANYIKERLKDRYLLPISGLCKHEFVFDGLREEYGGRHSDRHVTTLDVAKRLLDYGFHAPTIYFPLLFHEAMMIEPTETESKETIDHFIDTMRRIAQEAKDEPETVLTAPHRTPIGRPDDVKAVKDGKFVFPDE